MSLQSERGTLIDEYLQQHPSSNLHYNLPLELAGQRKDLPVYRIPTELLRFSIRNGRFAAELIEKEASLGRKIEETEEDLQVISRLLLEQNVRETEALKTSLKDIGQLHPGIVTDDGYVINGNRRMAALESLYSEENLPKYQYLEAARLPPKVDQKDLWRIEAGIQLSKEDKLEYGPVNERLKLREGIAAGLKPAEISRALFGRFSPTGVDEKLRELELIEQYLDFIGHPKEYKLVEQRTEAFIDTRAGLEVLENREASEDEIESFLLMCFEMIRDERTHWDVRKLNKIYRSGGEPAKQIIAFFSTPSYKAVPNTDKAMEVFEGAVEIYEADLDKGKPKKLLRHAYNTLQPLKVGDPALKGEETKEALDALWRRVYKLMKGSE